MQKLEAEIQKTGGTRKVFKELNEYGKECIPKLKRNKSKEATNRNPKTSYRLLQITLLL